MLGAQSRAGASVTVRTERLNEADGLTPKFLMLYAFSNILWALPRKRVDIGNNVTMILNFTSLRVDHGFAAYL